MNERRLARIRIDRRELVELMRGGFSLRAPDSFGQQWVRYSRVDVPSDLEIIGFEWDYAYDGVVLIVRIGEFPELAVGDALPVRCLTATTRVRRLSISIDES